MDDEAKGRMATVIRNDARYQTKDLGLVASIVSDDCRHSPFGLIIHTDHPSGISPTDMSLQYPNLFEKKEETASPEKKSFWKRLFS